MRNKWQTYPLQTPACLLVAISVACVRKSSERWNLPAFAARAAWTIEIQRQCSWLLATFWKLPGQDLHPSQLRELLVGSPDLNGAHS
jgi:hypothetical protein